MIRRGGSVFWTGQAMIVGLTLGVALLSLDFRTDGGAFAELEAHLARPGADQAEIAAAAVRLLGELPEPGEFDVAVLETLTTPAEGRGPVACEAADAPGLRHPALCWILALRNAKTAREFAAGMNLLESGVLHAVVEDLLNKGSSRSATAILEHGLRQRPDDPDLLALSALCELILARDSRFLISKVRHTRQAMAGAETAVAHGPNRYLPRKIRVLVQGLLPSSLHDGDVLQTDLALLRESHERRVALDRPDGVSRPVTESELLELETLIGKEAS